MLLSRRINIALVGAFACVLLSAHVAFAQEYDLNFTLPTAGKSGCMVCHADPNLGRLQGDKFVSYWVDPKPLDEGPHAGVLCTGCHLDFAYKAPHNIAETEWQRTARLACKNCHQDQWKVYSDGAHSLAVQPGKQATERELAKPLCGDCHGAHGIVALTDNPEGRKLLHEQGRQVCGRCHEDYWDNYSDYYHGEAYRRGATDAPSCWQCHGAHDIFPSDDRRSLVHERTLSDTCAECHPDTNEAYIAYAGLIHKRIEIAEANPLFGIINSAKDRIRGIFGQIRSWFT